MCAFPAWFQRLAGAPSVQPLCATLEENRTESMASRRKQRQYVAVLAAISAGILVVGSRLRPQQSPEMPVTQAEMVRLQSMTQRQNLQRLTNYFSEVADGVAPAVVWLEGLNRSGVVWDGDGLVLTAALRERLGRTVSAAWRGGEARLEPEVLSQAYPVAALRAAAPSTLKPVFRTDAASMERGAWIVHVAAAPGGEHLFAPGNLKGVVPVVCGGVEVQSVATSLPLTEQSLGGGVFNLDGNLLGLVIECEAGPAAVDTNGIDAILVESRSFEGQLLRRYGFRLRPLDERARKHFGTQMGLMVTEVRTGWSADRAGLEPGDIVQALDDVPVTTMDDLARLALPVALPAHPIYVERRGSLVRLEMQAEEADADSLDIESARGIALGEPAQGFLIERVALGSPAARASLEAGDRLLAVNGRTPRSAAEVRELLAGAVRQDTFVVVLRGQCKLGTFFRE